MSDLFTSGARLRSPLVAIFLRKGYGLGAMGLEGAVHLGFKKELDAVSTEAEREALFAKLISALYYRGKATEAATHL
jgi:acetyl-CoA carboxylase carboxyltransferase component